MSAPPGLDAFLLGAQARALRVAEVALRSRDDALDVVQDAMLHLARKYAQRPASEWPPLFHRILENKILDWHRRQTVKNRVFLRASQDPDDETATPLTERTADTRLPEASEQLMQAEAMQRLETAIARLPTRQRQAFTLRIWDGLSTDDTARVMGCTDGSVKTHLARALAHLRAEVGDAWSPERS